ncbi:leucine-rich repeat receptor-like serine/threonine/tyrosine-protein kinase SOBIR1 [Cryptomeria japonica]|uniref:leucine-rich repeat receptor-like serine/threonine/tyrosine-protein kinase SOBIR1 n=1 Tax=Cryptomeria japonica TaxID=3369 RepID=UPI0027DA689B|nr:leucine-rich repeat receptor-like serine/threonine/tyrosine-protein kinase SOBIR1 [Cryptomeria japonica]
MVWCGEVEKGSEGSLSPAIGRLSELKKLSFANNLLEPQGPIPQSLGSLSSLQILNLHNNFLHVKISQTLVNNSSKLHSLDVSGNFLVGRISPYIEILRTKRFLSVANNNLEGPIPWGPWFKYGADPSAFSGNTRLCGRPQNAYPNSKTATSDLCSSASSSSSSSKLSAHDQLEKQQSQSLLSSVLKRSIPESSLSTAPKTGIMLEDFDKLPPSLAPAPAPRAISAVICSFVYRMLLYCIRERPKYQGAKICSSLIKKAKDLAFLNTEDGLTLADLIGKWGSGEAYRTQLQYGTEIAIRKIAQPSLNSTDISDEDTKLQNFIL